MLKSTCDTSEYFARNRCILSLVKMHPRFCTYFGVKDVSQHLRLCIFQCVASAAHFFYSLERKGKPMKKVISLLLVLVMLLSLCACSKNDTLKTDPSTNPSQATNNTEEPTGDTTEDTQAPTEGPTTTPTEEPTTKPTETPTAKPTETPTTKPTETPTPKPTTCSHSYKDATCITPKTCTKCGAVSGSALGHSYKDATCTNPKTCTKCGATDGNKVEHSYTDGKCSFCGEEDAINPQVYFSPVDYVSLEKQENGISVIQLLWDGREYVLADTLYVKAGGDPNDFIDYEGERYYGSGGASLSFTYRLADTYIEFFDPGNEPCAKYALQHDGSLRLIALENGWDLPSLYHKGTLDELLSKLN